MNPHRGAVLGPMKIPSLSAMLLLPLAACAGDDAPAAGASAFLIETPVVGSLLAVSGQGQAGTAGTELAQPFVVQVRDPAGRPIPNHPVRFTIVRGEGRLWPETAITDRYGYASTRYQLGLRGGTDVVTAGPLPEGQYEPPTFTAGGTPWSAPLMNLTWLQAGSMITATTQVTNLGSVPFAYSSIAVEIRPRGGLSSRPDYRLVLDFPLEDGVVLPGQTVTLTASHEFGWVDPPVVSGPWEAFSSIRDAEGIAHYGPSLGFTVPFY